MLMASRGKGATWTKIRNKDENEGTGVQCLIDVPEKATSSSTEASIVLSKLIDAYPDDLNSNLYIEPQKFHSYIRHKARFNRAELYKVIVENIIECAFPNVEISLRIFLTFNIFNINIGSQTAHSLKWSV
jgi:hypothetical protein